MKDRIFSNRIEEIMSAAMEKIKPLVDSDVVVGKKIISGSTEIIPLTKVTLGFVTGGGEYYSELKEIRKETEYPFSGGSGGGVSIKPIAFLVMKDNEVELVKVDSTTAIEKLIEAIPELARFIDKNFSKK